MVLDESVKKIGELLSKEYKKTNDVNILVTMLQMDLLNTLVKQNNILIEQNQAIMAGLTSIDNNVGAMRLHFTGTYM